MGKDPDQIRREIEDTRDRMGGTVDAIAYRADVPGRMKDSISEKIDGVKSAVTTGAAKVGSAVTGTTSKVGHAIPDAGDVRDAGTRTIGMIKENPLGVLVSGIAVGFVVGSLLPSTDLEDERLGEVKNNLKAQVQEAGSEALQQGKAVLRDTVAAAQHSAHEHSAQFVQSQQSAQPESMHYADSP